MEPSDLPKEYREKMGLPDSPFPFLEGLAKLATDISQSEYNQVIRPKMKKKIRPMFDLFPLLLLYKYMAVNGKTLAQEIEDSSKSIADIFRALEVEQKEGGPKPPSGFPPANGKNLP